MSDAKQFSVGGVILKCKDEQAREDITEIKSNLTQNDITSDLTFSNCTNNNTNAIREGNKVTVSIDITVTSNDVTNGKYYINGLPTSVNIFWCVLVQRNAQGIGNANIDVNSTSIKGFVASNTRFVGELVYFTS